MSKWTSQRRKQATQYAWQFRALSRADWLLLIDAGACPFEGARVGDCAYCGHAVLHGVSATNPAPVGYRRGTIDHLCGREAGHKGGNLVVACLTCNNEKDKEWKNDAAAMLAAEPWRLVAIRAWTLIAARRIRDLMKHWAA